MVKDLSVMIPTKNEQENIAACLETVRWSDDVWLIDSYSTDRTKEIARTYDNVNVVDFDYQGGWPKKKNWALRNLTLKNDWVLILDADERVTPELYAEISEAIKDERINGCYLRWKFMFLGRWMKHCWSHNWILRLVRRGAGEYEDLGMREEGGWDNEVHENIVVNGRTACLNSTLLHESNQSLSYWIDKQNQFSNWNAKRRIYQLKEKIPPMRNIWSSDPLKRRKFFKALFIRTPGKPFIIFAFLYFFKLGILDGISGFYFCMLRAMHELNISAKIYEMRLASKEGGSSQMSTAGSCSKSCCSDSEI